MPLPARVKGRARAFVRRRGALARSRYRVFSSAPAAAGRSADSHPSADLVARPAAAADLAGNCMVLIGHRTDAIFEGDFPLAFKVGTELGLNPVDVFSGYELDTKLTQLAKKRCRDVLLR